jgi:ankyrin repeat protein
VDALDKHQRTALHWAAQGDKPDVLKLLLAKGASTPWPTRTRTSRCTWPPLAGSAEVTRLLLAKKADRQLGQPPRVHPLHLAAGKGAKPVVELLLRGGAYRAPRPSGASPCTWPPRRADRRRLLFLAKGVDINLRRRKTQGPIFYAAGGGHTELVKLLLDRKAAVTRHGLHGESAGTPLHDAARGGTSRPWSSARARRASRRDASSARRRFQVAADAGQVESHEAAALEGREGGRHVPQYGTETALHLATHQGHLGRVRS